MNSSWSAPAWRSAFTSGSSTRCHSRGHDISIAAPTSHCGFNVAGPASRELLQRLTNADLSNAAFPFMRSARIDRGGRRGHRHPRQLHRRSRLGTALRAEDQVRLYEALLEAGRELGAGPVGSRALMSLRVEKGYGSWGRDYSPEYWPQECGLDRLVKADKDFLNRDSLALDRQHAAARVW